MTMVFKVWCEDVIEPDPYRLGFSTEQKAREWIKNHPDTPEVVERWQPPHEDDGPLTWVDLITTEEDPRIDCPFEIIKLTMDPA